MALTTVAELRATLGVGTLYPDATLQEVCDATDVVLLPMLWQNEIYNTHQSLSDNVATLYFDQDISQDFYVGQSVIITKNGSPYNGTKTITKIGSGSLSYAATGADQGVHAVQPFGIVAGFVTDYATDTAVEPYMCCPALGLTETQSPKLCSSTVYREHENLCSE